MITSKALFQSSPAFAEFKTFRASAAWESACNAALMGLVEALPSQATEPSKSWDCYLQILGARAVLDIFSRLHEPDEPATQTKFPSLNYEASKTKTRP